MFFKRNLLLDSIHEELIPLEKEEKHLNKEIITLDKKIAKVQKNIKRAEEEYKQFLAENKPDPKKKSDHITNIDIKKIELRELKIEAQGLYLYLEMKQEFLTPQTRSTYPRKELWRLFIDGKNQADNNPMIFDNERDDHRGEPGYLANTRKAYLYMERTLHQPLTAEMVITIHDIAAKNKYDTSLGIKKQTTTVRISNGCITEEGAKEILTNLSDIVSPVPDLEAKDITAAVLPKSWIHEGKKDIRLVGDVVLVKLKSFIDEFKSEIKSANNDETKLFAIAKFIQKAELLHPSLDHNMRTMLIICNKLLLENGFTPVIFHNPNCVEGFAVHQICKAMKEGMEKAKTYMDSVPDSAFRGDLMAGL